MSSHLAGARTARPQYPEGCSAAVPSSLLPRLSPLLSMMHTGHVTPASTAPSKVHTISDKLVADRPAASAATLSPAQQKHRQDLEALASPLTAGTAPLAMQLGFLQPGRATASEHSGQSDGSEADAGLDASNVAMDETAPAAAAEV